jgi:hypothetical protein
MSRWNDVDLSRAVLKTRKDGTDLHLLRQRSDGLEIWYDSEKIVLIFPGNANEPSRLLKQVCFACTLLRDHSSHAIHARYDSGLRIRPLGENRFEPTCLYEPRPIASTELLLGVDANGLVAAISVLLKFDQDLNLLGRQNLVDANRRLWSEDPVFSDNVEWVTWGVYSDIQKQMTQALVRFDREKMEFGTVKHVVVPSDSKATDCAVSNDGKVWFLFETRLCCWNSDAHPFHFLQFQLGPGLRKATLVPDRTDGVWIVQFDLLTLKSGIWHCNGQRDAPVEVVEATDAPNSTVIWQSRALSGQRLMNHLVALSAWLPGVEQLPAPISSARNFSVSSDGRRLLFFSGRAQTPSVWSWKLELPHHSLRNLCCWRLRRRNVTELPIGDPFVVQIVQDYAKVPFMS